MPKVPNVKKSSTPTVKDSEGNEKPSNVNDQGQSATDAPQAKPADVKSQTAANPDTEANLTRDGEDPTKTVPVGGADATADHTADSRSNGTENTHPQSPVHQGDLSDSDKKSILEEFNAPGAQVEAIAEKHKITKERVIQVVDELNNVAEEDRLYG